MEDSTAMTIDFLRARLLSERSVSRTAKERADELAKRVVELEEQLKSVTLQRKKAEKATVEVLAILENREISDLFEALDSKFDQENIPCRSKENSNSMNEEESLVTSTWVRSETEEISGLELEGSPLSGKSLSWKSCNDTPSLEKKCNDQSGRKQCSFVSTVGSSSKPRTGKSCRQIRRRETISPGDEIGYETFVFDAQEDGGTSGLGDNSDNLEDTVEINKEGSKNEEKAFLNSLNSPKDQERETNADLDLLGNKTNVDMERALENQVQFIDQNVAQEKAQREWEEKFKENNACIPDSCENGNQSDITEERDDIRETVETVSSHSQGAKSETEEALASGETMTKMLPNVTLLTKSVDAGSSLDQQFKTTSVNEGLSDCWLPSQETPGSTAKGKQKQYCPDTLSCGSSDYQSTKKSSFQADGSEANGESSGNQNELQLTVWHEPPKELGVILEELQRAKVSLKRQLSRSPMSMKTPSVERITETPLPAIEAADVMKIPIGCAGLFRVPTDSQLESTTEANILCPPYCDSDLNVTRCSQKMGGMESDQDRISHNMEIGSKGSIRRPRFDSYMDVGMTLPGSNRDTYLSYADLLPRMTYKDGAFRSLPSFRPEMPANDHYFLYSERLRSNMHLRY